MLHLLKTLNLLISFYARVAKESSLGKPFLRHSHHCVALQIRREIKLKIFDLTMNLEPRSLSSQAKNL